MKSKSIALVLAAVTLSFGSLSFAQGYDNQRGDDHQRYEQRSEQHSGYQQRQQGRDAQRRFERHDQRYERHDRNDSRYGGSQAVYLEPTYVQPGYYAGEQPMYVQQGYSQPGYYGDSSASGDAALAILAGGLISQLLSNH